MPAATAIAAQALTRLGLLLGETRYLDAAARTLRAAWAPLQHYPHAHARMLVALEEHLDPPEIVIIRGPRDEAARWRDELAKKYSPTRLVFAIPTDAADLPAALADKRALRDDGRLCLPGHDVLGAGARRWRRWLALTRGVSAVAA